MIEEYVKIHDQFSLEIKIGFTAKHKQEINDFSFNTWIFIPNSLDINKYSYSKADFYRDVKSNIRLITPIYLLRDIANEKELPFKLLRTSFQKLASNPVQANILEYETHIKMFQSILKSSLRDEIHHIQNCKSPEDKSFLLDSFRNNCYLIASTYRSLKQIIHVPTVEKNVFEYYLFGDEFMSNIIELYSFKILSFLKVTTDPIYPKEKDKLLELINYEIDYKKGNGFPIIERGSSNRNRDAVSRFGALKKYIESQLFTNIKKREDGVVIKQIYYSLAAGISMIFATVIAFSFQQKYGNFTTPLFFALVISYMLKDRIKELSRIYFSYKLDSKYFDTKTDISFNNEEIGFYKESQTFVKENQTPREVVQLRNRSAILEAENRINDEKIMLYRFKMQLNRKDIKKSNVYPVRGVNNIIRFNVQQFIQKMDNPQVPLFIPDPNTDYKVVEGEKIYYINLIFHFEYQEQLEYKRYRIAFNREGIKSLEKL